MGVHLILFLYLRIKPNNIRQIADRWVRCSLRNCNLNTTIRSSTRNRRASRSSEHDPRVAPLNYCEISCRCCGSAWSHFNDARILGCAEVYAIDRSKAQCFYRTWRSGADERRICCKEWQRITDLSVLQVVISRIDRAEQMS